ncbi:hypothetical protein OF001_U140070 [Pseudomonas sp. OF001]|nr:hypothetical protein OF001_U140070 [Pseudomonas sp. OF001]
MGVTSATILPAIMQPLLPLYKERRNVTGATGLAQAGGGGPAIPLVGAFRYPSRLCRQPFCRHFFAPGILHVDHSTP